MRMYGERGNIENLVSFESAHDCLDFWGNYLTGTVCPPVPKYGLLFVRM